MRIKNATAPNHCSLCLQNAEAEIQRHLREKKTCTQPGCPLKPIIDAALENKRRNTSLRIGQRTRTQPFPNKQQSQPSIQNAKKSFWEKCKEKFREIIDFLTDMD